MKATFRKLEVDDLGKLEKLVTESLDGIEGGLTVVDARLLLGHATIDLVALDAHESLVLIALGFTADDGMLLRMLEAYSWCLDYPETIRKLYPAARVRLEHPPRVLFIAERMPDSFLRKVKRLSFPEIECLEFRYLEVNGTAGLCFDVVERLHRPISLETLAQPREKRVDHSAGEREVSAERHAPSEPKRAGERTAAPPEPKKPASTSVKNAGEREEVKPLKLMVGPLAETVVQINESASAKASGPEPAEEEPQPSPEQLGLGDIRLPTNGELSPQWKKFLSRTAGRVDPSRIRAVRDYIQREFPYCTIYDFYEFDRTAHVFNVEDRHGKVLHLTAVSEDFLSDHAESEIPRFLQHHKLADVMRQAGRLRVLVTDRGLKIENR